MRSTYEFTLTLDQYLGSLKQANRRALAHMPWGWLVQALGVGVFMAAGFLVVLSFGHLGGRYSTVTKPVFYASLILLAILVLYPLILARGQRALMSKPNFMVGTPRKLEIDASGLTTTHGPCSARYGWGGFESIERHGDMVFLNLDALFGIPIPVSAFADVLECQTFIDFTRERIRSHRHPTAASVSLAEAPAALQPAEPERKPADEYSAMPVDSLPSPAPALSPSIPATPSHPAPSHTAPLAANLRNAFKVTFFLPVAEEHFPFSWWQVLAFACASIAIPPLFSFAMTGPDGMIDWYALGGAMLHVGLALFAAIAAGYLLGQAERIPRLLLASMMIAAAIDAAVYLSWAVVTLLDANMGPAVLSAYQYGPPLWWALAFATHASRGNFAPPWRHAASLLTLAALLALPLASQHRDRNFWEPKPADSAAAERKPRKNPASEEVLNAQPALLARDLALVEPGRKGVPELFFVGMAGYADQDVFRKEIDAVEALFRERFDTTGHSIKLVNNRGTLTAAPFANVTNLRTSLQRVARQMNGDEDVLVLFLTSHGAENHEFSLEMWPLQFNKLNPQVLRKLLDESGIKHRVVVVSACYSGGFVNALRDDNTLVISASAADRNSFGCSNEAEWTYFGKAYFDEALRTTFSFTEAFEKALPVIAEREKKEDYKPSEPQMALGAGIAPKLDAIAASLSAKSPAAPDDAKGGVPTGHQSPPPASSR